MIIGIGIFVLISFLFYWYEYRPNKIRSNCENEIESTVKGTGKTLEEADFYYKMCLRKNGLEK